jgi:hypothetical protein
VTGEAIARCQVLGRTLLDKHGLGEWTLDFQNLDYDYLTGEILDRDRQPDGICDFGEKLIVISWRMDQRGFRQTMLHEMAHALRGVPGHDDEWGKIALRIGYSRKQLDRQFFCLAREKANL